MFLLSKKQRAIKKLEDSQQLLDDKKNLIELDFKRLEVMASANEDFVVDYEEIKVLYEQLLVNDHHSLTSRKETLLTRFNSSKLNKDIYEYTKQYEVDEKVAELEEALKNLKLDPEKVKIQKGDLDKNGIVNANDAAIALDLYKYGNVSAEELQIGDMDNNGIINANDAALILDIYKYGN